MKRYRIGYGFDVHQLVPDRRLVLGGVDIPFDKGLMGHSDADVLLHAVSDALLGAMAMGDIGRHFPDTDAEYKDADSRDLLRGCLKLLKQRSYKVGNVDATIVAQKPKLSPFIDQMRENMAEDLHLGIDDVSVKATTSEQLGYTGRGEGMSASAVVLIYQGE